LLTENSILQMQYSLQVPRRSH